MDSFHPANAHNADQSGDTRILSGTIWRNAAYSHSHSSVPHSIEDSSVRRVGQPSPLLRKHGLPVYRGNGQPASTRSSSAPTRHGRVIGATKSAHPELGSLPIVVPIDEAVRRTRRCSPCVCMWSLIIRLGYERHLVAIYMQQFTVPDKDVALYELWQQFWQIWTDMNNVCVVWTWPTFIPASLLHWLTRWRHRFPPSADSATHFGWVPTRIARNRTSPCLP